MRELAIRRRWAVPVLCLIRLAASLPASAAPGVTADAVVFGQSAAFTGPNSHLGTHYRAGIEAAFAERNALGGIDGRSLEILSLDDGYEPELAAANARRFADGNDVFAVIGGVGTPTAKRIAPILRAAEIAFVGPFTGADFLRDAERFPNVVNLRAGYLDETRVLVDAMFEDRGTRRFGIIYQDDAFGRSVLGNYRAVLDSYDLPLLARSTFSRNTHAVHASLFTLAKADLDAILVVGSYAVNALIINLAHALGHEYVIANLSFVGSRSLRNGVENPDERILVSEVMPDPHDTTRPLIQRFRDAMLAAHEESEDHLIDAVSLEGYVLGRFVIDVLERMEGAPTRERFLSTALSADPVAIDDWIIRFGPGTNVGSHYVRLTDFGGGADVPHGE